MCSVSAESDNNIVEFLTKLDFVRTDETENIDDYITRGEFANFTARLIPTSQDFKYDGQYFADVPKTHKYFNSIMLLKSKNYIKGVSDLYFNPDEIMQTDHAFAVLHKILGYETQKDVIGNLGKGIDTENNLKKSTMFKLMHNVLFSEVFPKEYYAYGTAFQKWDKVKYMESYFGIHMTIGIITDNAITSLYGKSQAYDGEVIINGITYTNLSGQNDFLGHKVRAYYKTYFRDIEEEPVIYCMEELSNDVKIFEAENILGFSNGTYRCLENDKEKNYTLDDVYKIIYNTKAVSNENSLTQAQLNNILKPSNGKVVLIDNNEDGKYDVCKITSYETIVVKGYIDKTHTFTNYLDTPASISFEDIDDVEIVDKNGAKRDFLSIKEYDVLSVMKTLDNKYAKIIISTECADGKITGYSEDSGISIVLDDVTYYVLGELSVKFNKEIIGKNRILLLNHDGYVAYTVTSAEIEETYAYIISAHKIGSLGEKVVLKVYTDENNLKHLELDKTVYIDGVPYKGTRDQYKKIIEDPYAIGYVAKIKLNSSEKIKQIDFPVLSSSAKEEEWQIVDGLHNVKEKFDATYVGIYKLAIGADTLGFFAPIGGQEERYFAGAARSFDAVYDAKRLVTAYVNKKSDMKASVVVLKSENNGVHDMSLSDSSRYFDDVIITNMSVELGNNGESLTRLEYTDGSGFYDVVYSDVNPVCRWSGKKVQIGDLVKFATDRKTGMINPGQIVVMYSAASDDESFSGLYYDSGVHGSDGKGSLYNKVIDTEARLIYGWIYAKDEEYIRLSYKKNPALDTVAFDDQYVFPLSSLKCIIYDPEATQKVRIGTHYDVNGYLNTGNASRVVLRTYQGSWIYVIK